MVYYVCSVELVESGWRHGFWIVFDSGQVHKVNSFMLDVVILPNFVKYPLQGCSMSEHCSVMIERDTVSYLAEEYHELSPSFCQELVTLYLGWIVGELRVWICEDLYPISVGFLGLPGIVPAIREEVAQSFVTVQPGSKLRLPYLELLVCETPNWELLRWVDFSYRHV